MYTGVVGRGTVPSKGTDSVPGRMTGPDPPESLSPCTPVDPHWVREWTPCELEPLLPDPDRQCERSDDILLRCTHSGYEV